MDAHSPPKCQPLSQIDYLFSSIFFQAVKTLQQVRLFVVLTIKVRGWVVQHSGKLPHDTLTGLMNALLILIHPRGG